MFRFARKWLPLRLLQKPPHHFFPISCNISSLRCFSSENRDALNYMESIEHTLPAMARRMLKENLLERVDPSTQNVHCKSILHSYLQRARTTEERHEIVASFSLLLTYFRMAVSSCPRCLFAMERCICDGIKPVLPHHKLWLFQHVGEYGRSNNTGSLLCLVSGARRTIRGIPEQQEEMLSHIDRHPNSTVILFPNKSSVTLEEYRQERVLTMGSDADENLTLVLLDGTSRQAKNFDRFMPSHIPRVRIREMNVHSWLDPIRRQTEEHRVCTAQGLFLMPICVFLFMYFEDVVLVSSNYSRVFSLNCSCGDNSP